MDKIILVGKLFKSDEINGPGAVIKQLERMFLKLKIGYDTIYLSESVSRFSFIKYSIKNILLKRNCIINVHTNGLLIPLFVLVISKLNRSNRYYLTVHGVYQIEAQIRGDSKKWYCLIEKILYYAFDNLICVSEMLRDDIERISGRNQRVYVIGNGTNAIDNQEKIKFKPDIAKQINLIMVGGISKNKGIFETIKIVDYLVNHKGIKVKLMIYGKVESRSTFEEYERYINDNNLNEVIFYNGLITNKYELFSLYKNSHFNVCLSKHDTFNVAIIEGMVLGCPCICTNTCGASYLIQNGVNGYVVNDSSNCREIYKIIKNYIDFSNSYDTLCENCRKIKKKVSWEEVVNKYIDLFSNK